MATTTAAILANLNQPLVVDEIELPGQLSFGQVLVRIQYSTICGSQLGEIDGVKGEDPYLPHLLGHEGSGIVAGVGPGVKSVKEGDPVVLHWMKGAGIEADTPSYGWAGRRVNAGWVTTFNEMAVVSENRVTRIPDGVDMALAPLFGCAITTGLGVVANNAKLAIGESAVVFGAGGVGLNVIQGAAMTSAYPIVAVDLFDDKLALAKQLGASHALNPRQADVPEELKRILGSGGADVVIETTGSPEVIQQAYALAGPRGRVVLVGVPRKGSNISIYSLPLHFGKVLTGSHGGETNPTQDIPRYIRLYQAGKLKLRELISGRFGLPAINEAIAQMRSGAAAGRCLIDMAQGGL
jgi:S-(hydroxymethyl)glutathione dehydrogenase/alcohol dehydrogenase